jgi:GalNAc5-diNAcBac-PP-undecaprenol beta-1,3-glucosyltransferase
MPAANGPTVSGVISSYNRKEFLRGAIESALAQTRPLDELIVVDDRSADDPADLVASFGDTVRYLRQPRNQGVHAARNAGVAAVRGDIVAFLDDDDQWHPTKLARQLPAFDGDFEASLCGWQYLGEPTSKVHRIDTITAADLRRGNPFCGASGLVARRRVLLEEPFDESLPKGEDWDLFVRLVQRKPLFYVDEALFYYRRGDYSGITQAGFHALPDELWRRAAVAHKHREWLGEWRYRNQIARNLLTNISKRPQKHRYVIYSIRKAGVWASLSALWEMKRMPR